ncbi:Prefoldin [Umbelopsis sp. AD052]|nr:Prefoldin [Umbelopsis sp. AD052]
MASSEQGQQIDLGDLDLPQLQQVKSQLEEELSHLTQSYSQLRGAQARFNDCKDSVDTLKTERAEDKTILVPLTSSLYVPGKLSNVETVIVDVGTGYFVEKSVADASKFYKEKIDYVKASAAKLQETITSKQSNVRALVNVMQDRIQEQQKN